MNFNYQQMMKQAKMVQKEMERVQEELKTERFEASSGGGAVKAVVNGDQELLEIKISKDAFDPGDLEMLEDMVLVAVKDAINQSKEESKTRLMGITGGFNIPGF